MRRNSLVQKIKNEQLSIEQILEYKEIFDILDRSKIGIISVDDIIKIRKIFYYPISQINVNKIIKEVDILENGKFNFKNFVAFMQKQIEYINETDENIIIKDIEEEIKKEYLGNKRKREKKNENEDLKFKKNKYSTEKNKKSIDNLLVINEESLEEQQSFSSDSSWNSKKKKKLDRTLTPDTFLNNNKKKKLDNHYNNIQINKSAIFENMNVKMIVGKDQKNNNLNDKINNPFNSLKNKNIDINLINNQNIGERQINEENKRNKSKNGLMPFNPIIIIMKKDLPQELVNQIEHKNNNILISQIKCNNLNNYINNNISNNINNINNNLNNSFNLSSDFGSIQKRYNIIDGNLGDEYPFLNDLNIDSINKTNFSGYSFNSRLCRIPTIKSNNKNKNYIDDYTREKYNEDKKDKLINFPFNNNNIFSKKNFIDFQNKNQLDVKSENSMNNSFYCSYNDNNNFGNNIYLNGGIDIYDSIICDNKYSNENKPNNNFNETDNNKINMSKIGKKSKSQGKNKQKNFQILNTFLFEYKNNRRREKIIQKSIEIPYSIIIEKKCLNMGEIEKSLSDDHINILNKDKRFSFSLKENRGNNFERNKDNKNMPFLLENFQIQIKNNRIKSISKELKNEKKNKKNKSQNEKEQNKKNRKKRGKGKAKGKKGNIQDKKLSFSIEIEPRENIKNNRNSNVKEQFIFGKSDNNC